MFTGLTTERKKAIASTSVTHQTVTVMLLQARLEKGNWNQGAATDVKGMAIVYSIT